MSRRSSSASSTPEAAPEERVHTVSNSGSCGECSCTCQMTCMKKHVRIWVISIALLMSMIALALNTHDAKENLYGLEGSNVALVPPHNGWSNEDKVLVAGFSILLFLFILALFVMKGAPACGAGLVDCITKPGCLPSVDGSNHSNWRNTFSLWCLVTAILHVSFVIEAADDQWRWKAAGMEPPAETLAAIFFAAMAGALLIYLTVDMVAKKVRAETNTNQFKDLLCVISLMCTILAFTCWVHSPNKANYWFNSIIIAGSCVGVLAIVDGIIFADQKDVGGSLSLTFFSFVASVLFMIFMIGAAVDLNFVDKKDSKLVVAMVFSFCNAVILFMIGCISQMNRVREQTKGSGETIRQMVQRIKPDLLIVSVTIFTVVQFSLAASQWTTPENGGNNATPPQVMLSLAVGCVFAAATFHMLIVDVVARGFHIAAAAVFYFIYFIYECVDQQKYADSLDPNVRWSEAEERLMSVRITALIFAALNCVFLTLGTIYFFCLIDKREAEVAPEEEVIEE